MIKHLSRKNNNKLVPIFFNSFLNTINLKTNWSMLTVMNWSGCRTCNFIFSFLLLSCPTLHSTIYYFHGHFLKGKNGKNNWKFDWYYNIPWQFVSLALETILVLTKFWYVVLLLIQVILYEWCDEVYLRYLTITAIITATAINTEILPPRIGIVGILDVYKKCENNLNTLQIFLDF